eukprot:jgi/Mesvir1/12758/Mv22822-RA.1
MASCLCSAVFAARPTSALTVKPRTVKCLLLPGLGVHTRHGLRQTSQQPQRHKSANFVIRASTEEEVESSIEEMEQRLKLGKRKAKENKGIPAGEKPLPVKPKKNWDDMTGSEKLTELYLGEKGFLYWLNQLAWYAIIGMVVLWALFRFVGPQFGLFDLQSPLEPGAPTTF